MSGPANTWRLRTYALALQAEAAVFDCDGTLVDSHALYSRAWRESLGHVGFAVEAG